MFPPLNLIDSSIIVSDIDQDYSAAAKLLGSSNADREAGPPRRVADEPDTTSPDHSSATVHLP